MRSHDLIEGSCPACRKGRRLAGHGFCAGCLLQATGLREGTGTGTGTGTELEPERIIGGYTVDSKIGEGGFAEVFSGTGPGGEVVAIKLLKEGAFPREVLKRFQGEQRVLRALQHPRIVKVMDSGESRDGRAFLVMEMVDGPPITDYCRAENLPLRRRAEIFAEVCDAVRHAHQKGVIHRDLKPSNLLMAEDGPKVIDFGIAKAMEEDVGMGHTLVTRLGQVMGTPAYMSPEQAAGGDEVDVRSDVYSLGAVFFEMLSGCAPFDAEAFRTLPSAGWSGYLLRTETGAPSLRSRPDGGVARAALRGDLDAIVLKAMAREPERRYESVQDLGQDVRRWLGGNPVLARPPSMVYQLRRLVRRHRLAAVVVCSVGAALLTATGAGFYIARQSRQAESAMELERDRARHAGEAARQAQSRAEREGYQAAIHLARLHLANGEPYLAAERLHATRPALRGWEWGHLLSATPPPEASAESGLPEASGIAASPDGVTVMVWDDRSACLLDLAGRPAGVLQRWKLPGGIVTAAVAPDGQSVALCLRGGGLRVFRRDGLPAWEIPFETEGAGLAWEPGEGGALVAVNGHALSAPGRLLRLDRGQGALLREIPLSRQKLTGAGLAIAGSGRWAVVRTSFDVLRIVTLPGLVERAVISAPGNSLISDFVPDAAAGRVLLAFGSGVSTASAETGEISKLFQLVDEGRPAGGLAIRRISLKSDGSLLALTDTGEADQTAVLHPKPRSDARAIAALANGRHAALLAGGRVEIRPDARPDPPASLPTRSLLGGVEGRRAVWSADSSKIASQGWDRTRTIIGAPIMPVRASAIPTGITSRSLEWMLMPVWHPDGSLITFYEKQPVVVRPLPSTPPTWDLAFLPLPPETWSATVLAGGSQAAFATPSGVSILDWVTGCLLREIPVTGAPFHLFTHGDGKTVFALGTDLRLHRFGAEPVTISLARAPAASSSPPPLAWHPGKSLLAIRLAGRTQLLQLSATGPLVTPRHSLPADSTLTAFAFSPDGRRLATASTRRELILWDWEESLPLLEFPIRATASSIAFSPDGHWLANTDFGPSLELREAPPRP